ncbi:hypothetical protein AALP_AA7G198400 [Arabis alpina]|uniref:Uncharacterized protein n=1 Tax=Arabis alpina TaxID=50452 RepID=A0A087GJ93_ARAAL|nr:hypothetical protein AALP_AA7G198400 [Arabis alpina]
MSDSIFPGWDLLQLSRIGLMRYSRGWRIKSQAGEGIKMHFFGSLLVHFM